MIPIDKDLPSKWSKADARGRSGEVCFIDKKTILKKI
jgi:hypothetical protein